jgi:predicted O-methyltransferase YrrM
MNPNTTAPPDTWHPAAAMAALTHLATDRTYVLEVGTWLGHSALALAAADGCQTVYCVDHWEGSKQTGEVADVLSFYQRFLERIRSDARGSKVVPLFGDSERIARLFAPHSLDLVYIDGEHQYAGIMRDLLAWYRTVKPGGIICGDDYREVAQALNDFFDPDQRARLLVSADRIWSVEVR